MIFSVDDTSWTWKRFKGPDWEKKICLWIQVRNLTQGWMICTDSSNGRFDSGWPVKAFGVHPVDEELKDGLLGQEHPACQALEIPVGAQVFPHIAIHDTIKPEMGSEVSNQGPLTSHLQNWQSYYYFFFIKIQFIDDQSLMMTLSWYQKFGILSSRSCVNCTKRHGHEDPFDALRILTLLDQNLKLWPFVKRVFCLFIRVEQQCR